jgi:hypothetical protein
MQKRLERSLEDSLKDKLERMGCLFFKWTSGVSGVPDRICILPGGAVWLLELKSDDGRLSKRQKYVQEQIRLRGAFVVTLAGEEDCKGFASRVAQEIAIRRSVGLLESYDKKEGELGAVHPTKLPDVRSGSHHKRKGSRAVSRTWFRENSVDAAGHPGADPGKV